MTRRCFIKRGDSALSRSFTDPNKMVSGKQIRARYQFSRTSFYRFLQASGLDKKKIKLPGTHPRWLVRDILAAEPVIGHTHAGKNTRAGSRVIANFQLHHHQYE